MHARAWQPIRRLRSHTRPITSLDTPSDFCNEFKGNRDDIDLLGGNTTAVCKAPNNIEIYAKSQNINMITATVLRKKPRRKNNTPNLCEIESFKN